MNPWLGASFTQQWLHKLLVVALAALAVVPLGAISLLSIASVWDASAWLGFWQKSLCSRLWLSAWGMTLWTGFASTLLAYGLCAWLVSHSFARPLWARTVRVLGPMLAVPHAAFAVGLVFLISPSGWILRVFSPWATGLSTPPPWVTTQDPWALGLILALVAKEVPFLLWAAASQLQVRTTPLRGRGSIRTAVVAL